MSNRKNVVYFPSLSAGAYSVMINKDDHVLPGVPYRFWSDETPEEWRHKYFLVTAGHLYKKKPEVRKKWNLEDTLVFGDSGGFQIATGVLKWDLALRDTIFEWLETNSDIAANIDIPPRGQFEGRFQDALEMSLDNFKYFEKKQTGKTKFLNILQGTNPAEFNTWYNTVQGMDFKGWCIGSSRKMVDFMYALALMIEKKEFLKPYNEWVHLLGISKVSDFFILAQFQKMLNEYTGNRITVSTDSSSPGQYPVYGQMVYAPNFKEQTFSMLYFPKDGTEVGYPTEGLIPSLINHPGTPALKWDMLRNYSTEAVSKLSYHNLHMYIWTTNTINDLIQSGPLSILEMLLPKDLYLILQSMEEMFHSEKPMAIYEKYRQYYINYGGDNLNMISKEAVSEYLDFTAHNEESVRKKRKLTVGVPEKKEEFSFEQFNSEIE